MTSVPFDFLLSQAERAFAADEPRKALTCILRVLGRDFTNEPAWRLLHDRMNPGQPFEIFRAELAHTYFPDKAHLLPTGSFSGQAHVMPAPRRRLRAPRQAACALAAPAGFAVEVILADIPAPDPPRGPAFPVDLIPLDAGLYAGGPARTLPFLPEPADELPAPEASAFGVRESAPGAAPASDGAVFQPRALLRRALAVVGPGAAGGMFALLQQLLLPGGPLPALGFIPAVAAAVLAGPLAGLLAGLVEAALVYAFVLPLTAAGTPLPGLVAVLVPEILAGPLAWLVWKALEGRRLTALAAAGFAGGMAHAYLVFGLAALSGTASWNALGHVMLADGLPAGVAAALVVLGAGVVGKRHGEGETRRHGDTVRG